MTNWMEAEYPEEDWQIRHHKFFHRLFPAPIPLRELWALPIEAGWGFDPLPELFEDPWHREIRDNQYRHNRGSWDIAELPVLDDPPEYELPPPLYTRPGVHIYGNIVRDAGARGIKVSGSEERDG